MAAIRMLFSWLTEKGVLAMNPAREVKTERFSRTEGKTPAFVDPEPGADVCKSQHHLFSRRLFLFPLRPPGDQLQVVAFPLTACGGHSAC
jgi:hypothetical protein